MCIICIANNINRNVYMYLNAHIFPTTGYARVLLFMFIRRELGGTGTGCLFQFTYCAITMSIHACARSVLGHASREKLIKMVRSGAKHIIINLKINIFKDNKSTATIIRLFFSPVSIQMWMLVRKINIFTFYKGCGWRGWGLSLSRS